MISVSAMCELAVEYFIKNILRREMMEKVSVCRSLV